MHMPACLLCLVFLAQNGFVCIICLNYILHSFIFVQMLIKENQVSIDFGSNLPNSRFLALGLARIQIWADIQLENEPSPEPSKSKPSFWVLFLFCFFHVFLVLCLAQIPPLRLPGSKMGHI